MASFLQGPKPTDDLPSAVGAQGIVPFVEDPFGVVEGSPSLGVLTLDDFVLRPEASRAFAVASSLLRSREVERLLAQRPLEEPEARLVAAALLVSSIGYDLPSLVLGPE